MTYSIYQLVGSARSWNLTVIPKIWPEDWCIYLMGGDADFDYFEFLNHQLHPQVSLGCSVFATLGFQSAFCDHKSSIEICGRSSFFLRSKASLISNSSETFAVQLGLLVKAAVSFSIGLNLGCSTVFWMNWGSFWTSDYSQQQRLHRYQSALFWPLILCFCSLFPILSPCFYYHCPFASFSNLKCTVFRVKVLYSICSNS